MAWICCARLARPRAGRPTPRAPLIFHTSRLIGIISKSPVQWATSATPGATGRPPHATIPQLTSPSVSMTAGLARCANVVPRRKLAHALLVSYPENKCSFYNALVSARRPKPLPNATMLVLVSKEPSLRPLPPPGRGAPGISVLPKLTGAFRLIAIRRPDPNAGQRSHPARRHGWGSYAQHRDVTNAFPVRSAGV